ncbi:hypothetical protein QFZ37_003554 [Chryseobacterium ginsenosidimutans]|nr:hypothetical protein [Chryseobacterium ginsenosidimutans]
MLKLVPDEYAEGTYKLYVTARSHVQEFVLFKSKGMILNFESSITNLFGTMNST